MIIEGAATVSIKDIALHYWTIGFFWGSVLGLAGGAVIYYGLIRSGILYAPVPD